MDTRSDRPDINSFAPILEALAKNPQMISGLMTLMGNANSSSSGFKVPEGLFDNLPESAEESSEEIPDAEPVSTSVNEASNDIFSAINPEMIAKIPDIISAAKPVMEAIKCYRSDSRAAESQARRPGVSSDKRNALLLALKPYVNEHRQHTVDMILSVSKFSSVLKK